MIVARPQRCNGRIDQENVGKRGGCPILCADTGTPYVNPTVNCNRFYNIGIILAYEYLHQFCSMEVFCDPRTKSTNMTQQEAVAALAEVGDDGRDGSCGRSRRQDGRECAGGAFYLM